jgi:hypothetical protein
MSSRRPPVHISSVIRRSNALDSSVSSAIVTPMTKVVRAPSFLMVSGCAQGRRSGAPQLTRCENGTWRSARVFLDAGLVLPIRSTGATGWIVKRTSPEGFRSNDGH